MWEFLGLDSERGGSVCWPNNKIIDVKLRLSIMDFARESILNPLCCMTRHKEWYGWLHLDSCFSPLDLSAKIMMYIHSRPVQPIPREQHSEPNINLSFHTC